MLANNTTSHKEHCSARKVLNNSKNIFLSINQCLFVTSNKNSFFFKVFGCFSNEVS